MAAQISNDLDYSRLAVEIKRWGMELGFQQVGISDTDLQKADHYLQEWNKNGYQGDMEYMVKHGSKRSHPNELFPGTTRIISVRLDYYPDHTAPIESVLENPEKAFVSRYALGRDYHKVVRNRLQKLVQRIDKEIANHNFRVYCDSAPVLEKAIAEKSGLGWIGKHTNVINKKAGSWFFLGEIYTNIPLPTDAMASNHCGDCQACIDCCPTKAIIAPYKLDARRCISYLTIEHKGSIPETLRPLIGNRIYGCDDCQMVCPWNRFSQMTNEADFTARHKLDSETLIRLFNWTEADFLKRTEGSAIRRIGYERWLRNIAVALGNAPTSVEVIQALQQKQHDENVLVQEHVVWALHQHHAV